MLVKNKTFQIIAVIVAAVFIGPAVAGLMGLTGGSAVAVSALVGGLVGGVGFQGLGLGTFEQGFVLGALAGGLAGWSGQLYGNNNPLFNYVEKEITLFKQNTLFNYLFNPHISGISIFGDPYSRGSVLGGLLVSQLLDLIPKKKENER